MNILKSSSYWLGLLLATSLVQSCGEGDASKPQYFEVSEPGNSDGLKGIVDVFGYTTRQTIDESGQTSIVKDYILTIGNPEEDGTSGNYHLVRDCHGEEGLENLFAMIDLPSHAVFEKDLSVMAGLNYQQRPALSCEKDSLGELDTPLYSINKIVSIRPFKRELSYYLSTGQEGEYYKLGGGCFRGFLSDLVNIGSKRTQFKGQQPGDISREIKLTCKSNSISETETNRAYFISEGDTLVIESKLPQSEDLSESSDVTSRIFVSRMNGTYLFDIASWAEKKVLLDTIEKEFGISAIPLKTDFDFDLLEGVSFDLCTSDNCSGFEGQVESADYLEPGDVLNAVLNKSPEGNSFVSTTISLPSGNEFQQFNNCDSFSERLGLNAKNNGVSGWVNKRLDDISSWQKGKGSRAYFNCPAIPRSEDVCVHRITAGSLSYSDFSKLLASRDGLNCEDEGKLRIEVQADLEVVLEGVNPREIKVESSWRKVDVVGSSGEMRTLTFKPNCKGKTDSCSSRALTLELSSAGQVLNLENLLIRSSPVVDEGNSPGLNNRLIKIEGLGIALEDQPIVNMRNVYLQDNDRNTKLALDLEGVDLNCLSCRIEADEEALEMENSHALIMGDIEASKGVMFDLKGEQGAVVNYQARLKGFEIFSSKDSRHAFVLSDSNIALSLSEESPNAAVFAGVGSELINVASPGQPEEYAFEPNLRIIDSEFVIPSLTGDALNDFVFIESPWDLVGDEFLFGSTKITGSKFFLDSSDDENLMDIEELKSLVLCKQSSKPKVSPGLIDMDLVENICNL